MFVKCNSDQIAKILKDIKNKIAIIIADNYANYVLLYY